jgi:hypothetical protein
LACNTLPAFDAFGSSSGQMSFSATRDDRNDSGCAQFGALFDRPFHAVKFEDGETKRDIRRGGRSYFVAQFEFNSVGIDARDASATDIFASSYFEFLSYTGAKYSGQVFSVFTGEGSAIAGNFVGDPAAAGHKCSGQWLVASG